LFVIGPEPYKEEVGMGVGGLVDGIYVVEKTILKQSRKARRV
jgi:hypothetical protein